MKRRGGYWTLLGALWTGWMVGWALEPVRAEVIVGIHDWNSGSEGWSNLGGVVTLDTPADGGVGDTGWQKITFPASGDPADAWDLVYVSSSSLFAGGWQTNMWVQFDFMASNAVPDHLQVWWGSSSNTWMSGDIAFSGTGTWSTVLGPTFAYWNWMPDTFGLNEDVFLADLSAIDWIGIYIWRGGSDEQIYGIDNFSLMVPEPGEWVMLLAALTVTVASTRRRKREAVPIFQTGT